MSRNVPFDDPLLHPPSQPTNAGSTVNAQQQQQLEQTPGNNSLQYDDGPIPFQTSSSTSGSSVFSPTLPPPPPPRPTANIPVESPRITTTTGVSPVPGASSPSFVDPLTAAVGNLDRDEYPKLQTEKRNSSTGPSPGNSNIPTGFPTHLASPPIPNRPSSSNDTPFAAFHNHPSKPISSPTPDVGSRSDNSLVDKAPNLSLDSIVSQSAHQSPAIGSESEQHESSLQENVSTPGQQWNRRHSVGVSTYPSGFRLQDHSDMIRQDLKSPKLENSAGNILQGSPVSGVINQLAGNKNYSQLNISPSNQSREYPVGHIPAEQRVRRDWKALTEVEQRQAPRMEILHELTINNSWRAMTRYTRSQILATSHERIPELVNLWYARLLALVKIGQYEMAHVELDQLGDLWGPQYRYENYPPGMFSNNEFQTNEQQRNCKLNRGSIIPFELYILKARLQGYLGDIYEAIDQLYGLIIHCKKHEAICHLNQDSVGERQWHDLTGQLHLMVLNYLVELKDYPSATRHGRELAKAYPQDVNFHSGLGRLYLQLGDTERAEEAFKGVEEMVKQHNSETEVAHFKLQLSMNRALLAVTQGQWLTAKSVFEDILIQEPANIAAANNLVVCELYAGQLNSAIPRLEQLMFVSYPRSAGTSEPLVFNMATLYELRTEGSLRKKQQMMVEVCKWAGDQFNVGVFKV
ncbi:Trafficking protein particle complex subunit 12 [Entomortierella beljakovae]|nr:Trafficking protein particle complex subunit 12 [Entomortierella beljakovae]